MNAQLNNYKIHLDCIELHYFYRTIPGVMEIKIPIDKFETWIKDKLPDVYVECFTPQIINMTNSDEEQSGIIEARGFSMSMFEEFHMKELIARYFLNDFMDKQIGYAKLNLKTLRMKIIHNEKAKKIDFLDQRFYESQTQKDVYYPSVTTVLEAYPKGYGFNEWLKSVGQNADMIVQKAADQGTKIHNAIDEYLTGIELFWAKDNKAVYILEEWQMILRFKDFYDRYKPKILAHEQTIVSDSLKIGGTVDLVCEIEGIRWLIDYKSSNSIYNSHYVQICTYTELWNEKYPDKPIQKNGILWLKALTRGEDKTGKKIQGERWQMKEPPFEQEHGTIYYESARRLWNLENPNAKPKNKIFPDRIKL